MTRAWIVDTVGAETFARLADELPGTALHSLLLEVLARRAAARTPAEVLTQYRRDRFVMPAAIYQRTSVSIYGALLAAAADFEALELSPVAPLATCSSVAPTSQHRTLSATRGTEVVADPTNVLALEIAARWQAKLGARTLRLATSQRVVRAQPVPKLPGYANHFRIFCLATGGIERPAHAFIVDTVASHVRTLLAALDRLEALGHAFGARRVELLATEARAPLAARIAATLALPSTVQPLTLPYYSGGLRVLLWCTTPEGREVPLADTGTFDWLATLTSNRRAVYVASGLGAQLVPALFRAP